MLWWVVVILILLWALGFFTGTTFGGLVHALLIIALIVIVFNLVTGRRQA